MLTKDGKNGYDETFWKLHVPAEHCAPGLEVGIVVGERGITIGGGLIAWSDIDAARAELSPIKGGGEAVACWLKSSIPGADIVVLGNPEDIHQAAADTKIPLYTRPPVVAEAEPVGLTFNALRTANAERIGSSKYRACEENWTPAHWMQATVGELGELANLLRKVDRGDFPFEQVKTEVAKELADVQTYLDILALKLGVDLGQATIDKFNEVSERIGSHVRLAAPLASGAVPVLRRLVSEIDRVVTDEETFETALNAARALLAKGVA